MPRPARFPRPATVIFDFRFAIFDWKRTVLAALYALNPDSFESVLIQSQIKNLKSKILRGGFPALLLSDLLDDDCQVAWHG
jgi:hypothetical protein